MIRERLRERMDSIKGYFEAFPDPLTEPRLYTYGGPNEQGLITLATEYYKPDFDINLLAVDRETGEYKEMLARTEDGVWVYFHGPDVLLQADGTETQAPRRKSITLDGAGEIPVPQKDQPWEIAPGTTVGPIKILSVKHGEYTQARLDTATKPVCARPYDNFEVMRRNALAFRGAEQGRTPSSPEPAVESRPEASSVAAAEPGPATKPEARPEPDHQNTEHTWHRMLGRVLHDSVQTAAFLKSEAKNYYNDEVNGRTRKLATLAVAAVAVSALRLTRE